jgi:hypothetical protein
LFSLDNDIDVFELGYVNGDDAIPFLKDFEKIYKSYGSICEKLIPLSFPLVKKQKWELAAELPRNIYDLTVSCENPHIDSVDYEVNSKLGEWAAPNKLEYVPCGECPACLKIISSDNCNIGLNDKFINVVLNKSARMLSRHGYNTVDHMGNPYNCGCDPCELNVASLGGTQLEIPFEETPDLVYAGDYESTYIERSAKPISDEVVLKAKE